MCISTFSPGLLVNASLPLVINSDFGSPRSEHSSLHGTWPCFSSRFTGYRVSCTGYTARLDRGYSVYQKPCSYKKRSDFVALRINHKIQKTLSSQFASISFGLAPRTVVSFVAFIRTKQESLFDVVWNTSVFCVHVEFAKYRRVTFSQPRLAEFFLNLFFFFA